MTDNITLYASGRVAVLSTKLIGREKLNRIAESNSLDAAVKILYENNYAGGMTVNSGSDFEQLLDKELEITVDFFKSMSPNKFLTDCFILGYDYTNAKLLQKARRMGIDAKNSATKFGNIDVNFLADAIDSIDYDDLPKPMSDALRIIDEAYESGKGSAQFIDTVLDKAKYANILDNLKFAKSIYANEYFTADIDMMNILTAFRCLYIHYKDNQYAEMFIDGGSLILDEIVKAYGKGLDGLLNYTHDTPYRKLGDICAESIRQDKPIVNAEIYFSNIKKKILTPYKNDMETVYPLVNYFMSKKTEIENLRWILVGVKNGVKEEVIKSRIKELYV